MTFEEKHKLFKMSVKTSVLSHQRVKEVKIFGQKVADSSPVPLGVTKDIRGMVPLKQHP